MEAKGNTMLPPQEPEKIAPSPWVSMGGHGLPPRTVVVDPFVIDRTEVTRAAYFRFLRDTGYRLPHVAEPWADDGWNWTVLTDTPEDPDHPVVMVSFYDAREYCLWRSMRLPTEAEWQLAALGAAHEGRIFPWGSRYDGLLLNHGRMEEPNFDDSDGHVRTAPVGSFPAGRSPFGLEDAFGNAWEFTGDFRMDDWRWMQHDGYGQQSSIRNARMTGPGLRVAVRGGSFYFDFRPNPGGEWTAFSPEVRRKSSGFRCAADA
jgi:formylglycine-generating enzyme required for sulfatase activity